MKTFYLNEIFLVATQHVCVCTYSQKWHYKSLIATTTDTIPIFTDYYGGRWLTVFIVRDYYVKAEILFLSDVHFMLFMHWNVSIEDTFSMHVDGDSYLFLFILMSLR